MRILYTTDKKECIQKEGDKLQGALLTGASGGYYLIHPKEESQYTGWYLPFVTNDGWNLIKGVHSFFPKERSLCAVEYYVDAKEATITYKFEHSHATIAYRYLKEQIMQCHVTNYQGTIPLLVDCRCIYDFADQGREYSVEQQGNITIISYYKKEHGNSTILPQSAENTPYVYHIAILASKDVAVQKVEQWTNQEYQLDIKRGGNPVSSYIFHAVDAVFEQKKDAQFFITQGTDKEICIRKLEALRTEKITHPKNVQLTRNTMQTQLIAQVDEKVLDRFVKHAMQQFVVQPAKEKGIYAGYPWFYQFWTRDEAISCIGLLKQKQYKEVKDILLRQLAFIHEDGRITNRYPYSKLGSADGIGWNAKRMYDLVTVYDEEQKKNAKKKALFTTKELKDLCEKYIDSVQKLQEQYVYDDLVWNRPLETWMDTGAEYDVREGTRIEIQALYLIQLKLISLLCKKTKTKNPFSGVVQQVKKKVKEQLFHEYLADGLDINRNPDMTVRPNVLLAYYIYPQLLTKKEWEQTADVVLEKCFVQWGGITTIEKSHPLYCEYYTGQNNKSYHRGDVWYFVNNICATALLQLNKKKYQSYITAIKDASVKEFLEQGLIGCAAEVSSAAVQTSDACLQQAWSVATLLELLDELKE